MCQQMLQGSAWHCCGHTTALQHLLRAVLCDCHDDRITIYRSSKHQYRIEPHLRCGRAEAA